MIRLSRSTGYDFLQAIRNHPRLYQYYLLYCLFGHVSIVYSNCAGDDFLLVFPFFSEQRSVKEVLYQSVRAIVRENFALIGDLIVILSINLGIWAILMLFLSSMTIIYWLI